MRRDSLFKRLIHFIFHSPSDTKTNKARVRESGRERGVDRGTQFCIILIFIYILSILHNARVTTEIVGWQFINT